MPHGYLDFREVREEFRRWLEAKGVTRDYVVSVVSVLERFSKPISSPSDIPEMFMGLSSGRRNKLIKALRNLFNFYEAQGYDPYFIALLRKSLPKASIGCDIRVPAENDVIEALKAVRDRGAYEALFNLVLDSGLRVIEATEFLRLYKSGAIRLEAYGGFYIAQLGMLKGNKNAYAAFITESTKSLLDNLNHVISYRGARKIKDRAGSPISLKYLRKFAFDKMVELKIPESVADFIEGRTPVKVCAKHYMNLLKQAITYYPRYAEYLRTLREKALK